MRPETGVDSGTEGYMNIILALYIELAGLLESSGIPVRGKQHIHDVLTFSNLSAPNFHILKGHARLTLYRAFVTKAFLDA